MGETVMGVEEYLALHGMSKEATSPRQLAQLEKIHDSLAARAAAASEARKSLRASRITLTGVAEDTGISRKTFYNNEVLRAYVEETARRTEPPARSGADERTKELVEDLQRQVRGFVVRDVETERLRVENESLRREIAQDESRIAGLERTLEETRRQLRVALSKIPADAALIIRVDPERK